MALSPQGYELGGAPYGEHPFWTSEITGDYVKSCSATSTEQDGVTTWHFSYIDQDGEEHVYADVPITAGGASTAGYTFTPHITTTADGYILSWTNDGDLPNPDPVTITNGKDGAQGPQGPQGEKGDTGAQGEQGKQGVTFTPIVSASDGKYTMRWENDGGLDNPSTVYWYNGTQGEKGDTGDTGTTFTPTVTSITDADGTTGYEMSWTNDGGKDNPDPVQWYNGKSSGDMVFISFDDTHSLSEEYYTAGITLREETDTAIITVRLPLIDWNNDDFQEQYLRIPFSLESNSTEIYYLALSDLRTNRFTLDGVFLPAESTKKFYNSAHYEDAKYPWLST